MTKTTTPTKKDPGSKAGLFRQRSQDWLRRHGETAWKTMPNQVSLLQTADDMVAYLGVAQGTCDDLIWPGDPRYNHRKDTYGT